jgi:hypothetical protein
MRVLVSIVALAVILLGVRFAYGRERLRKTDLHAWYREDSAQFFDGQLPDVYVRWGNLQEQEAVGMTEVDEEGFLEIILDRYDNTTADEARATLRHEECHCSLWGHEEPLHGPEFQACMTRLEKFVEVK